MSRLMLVTTAMGLALESISATPKAPRTRSSGPTVRMPYRYTPTKRWGRYPGQTPEQAQAALDAAQAKRDRRIERNYRNEAAQGRGPDDLELVDGAWIASCRSCSKPYTFEGDARQFTYEVNFCGRNQWCSP